MPGHHIYSILEALQYGTLYCLAAFAGGVGLDFTFPRYKKDTPTRELLREAVLQSLSLIVVVFFIRLIIQRVPILFPVPPRAGGYKPYETTEFNGEMMMGLVFLSSQVNLLAKIDELSKRLYKYYYDEEKMVEHDL
jgi:hypothetical protein